MHKLRKLMVSPSRIYGWSIVGFLVIVCAGIPILNFGNKGQVPFSHLFIVIAVYMVVLFALSIFTTIIYWAWFKKYWFINLVVAAGSAYVVDLYLLGGLLTGD
jgi:hypothetical protein